MPLAHLLAPFRTAATCPLAAISPGRVLLEWGGPAPPARPASLFRKPPHRWFRCASPPATIFRSPRSTRLPPAPHLRLGPLRGDKAARRAARKVQKPVAYVHKISRV